MVSSLLRASRWRKVSPGRQPWLSYEPNKLKRECSLNRSGFKASMTISWFSPIHCSFLSIWSFFLKCWIWWWILKPLWFDRSDCALGSFSRPGPVPRRPSWVNLQAHSIWSSGFSICSLTWFSTVRMSLHVDLTYWFEHFGFHRNF